MPAPDTTDNSNCGNNGSGTNQCKKECERPKCEAVGSSVNMFMRAFTDNVLDLSLKTPGGTIDITRSYYDNGRKGNLYRDTWHWQHSRQLEFDIPLYPESAKIATYVGITTVDPTTLNDSQAIPLRNITREGVIFKPDPEKKTVNAVTGETVTLRPGDKENTDRIIYQGNDMWRWENKFGDWEEYYYPIALMSEDAESLGRYARSKIGQMTAYGDRYGASAKMIYDEWDNLVKVVYPDGAQVDYTYDPDLQKVIKKVDENRVQTHYFYDEASRLIRRVEADGTDLQRTTEFEYDADGNLETIRRPGDTNTADAVTTMTYDADGNMETITDPEQNVTTFTYDVAGNVLTNTDALQHTWAYTYDDSGRLKTVTDPLEHVTEYFYDEVGNKIREVDPEGKETAYEYDVRDNLKDVHANRRTIFSRYPRLLLPIK